MNTSDWEKKYQRHVAYRDVSGFKKSCHSTVTKEKDNNGDMRTGSNIFWISGRIIFARNLITIHGVKCIRKIETRHT
jgi:hypothetical protein